MKVTTKFKKICSYQSSDFKEWFGDMEYVNEKHPLVSKILERSMNDKEIFNVFNPEPVSLGDVFNCLKTMSHDKWMIFYVKDYTGVLRAVDVHWSVDGWYVRASSVESPSEWDGGRRVFSRNFRESDTLTLAIEEVKKAGYVIYKPV